MHIKTYGKLAILLSAVIMVMIAGCTIPGLTEKENMGNSQIANPAAKNCVDKGGKLSFQKGADGWENEMCTLSDGTVCEEWAYFRGECPKVEKPIEKPIVKIANPASTNCVEKGGKLDIVKDEAGGEVGMCTLQDGTVCEEWAYLRGECPKAANLTEAEGPDKLFGEKTFTYIGDTLDLGEIKIAFNGFNTQADDYPYPPSLQITEAKGALLAKKKISVRTYETYTTASNKTYLIYVSETGNGFSTTARWAHIRVYQVIGSPDNLADIKAQDETLADNVTDNGAQPDSLVTQKTINISETVDAGMFKIRLDDLSTIKNGSSPAMLTIMDANATILKQTIIETGGMMVYRLPNGDRYATYVEETAALEGNGWAKVWVYNVNNQPDVLSIKPDYRVSTTGWPLKESSNLSAGGIIDLVNFKVRLDGVAQYPIKNPKSAIVTLLDRIENVSERKTIPAGYGIFYTNKDGDRFLVFCDSTTDKGAKISVYMK